MLQLQQEPKHPEGHRVGGRTIVLCCMTTNRTQIVQAKSSNRADIRFLHKVVCHDYNPCRACHQPLAANQEWQHNDTGLESPPAQALGVLELDWGLLDTLCMHRIRRVTTKTPSGALSLGKNEERTTKHVSLSQVITRCMMSAMIPLPHEYIYYRNNSIVITILSRIE